MHLPVSHLPRRSRRALLVGLALLALVGLFAGTVVWKWVHDPGVPLLLPAGGAEWILLDEPFRLTRRKLKRYEARFRKRFEATAPGCEAVLTVQAFRSGSVFLDGKPPGEPRDDPANWKVGRRYDLAGLLGPGTHEVEIRVWNEDAPAAVLAFSESVGLRTGSGWEASPDGAVWRPALRAGTPRRPALALRFPTALEALRSRLPILAAVFLAAAGLAWARGRAGKSPWPSSLFPTPGVVRWLLLWAWALLAANNILKLPVHVGFDARAHHDYIRHVAERWTVPLASDGWQMFQSPLYYLVSAPFHLLFSSAFEPETAERLLRIIPLAAGAAQVQLSYLAARMLYPHRAGLQVAATLVGGLVPMNLYVSQAVGNEPLAGCLSGAVLIATLTHLTREGKRIPPPWIGILLGLALLAKATAVILIIPVAAAVAWGLWTRERSAGRAARGVAALLAASAMVSGWYYARNGLVFGKPFVGGWDPARGIVWWQDPGYRTLEQLTSFGESLVRPILASTVSLWDGLYSTLWADGYLGSIIDHAHRPPWDYGFLLAGPLLGLVPSGAMLAGVLRMGTGSGREQRVWIVFATGTIALHVAALACLFAALPVYSTVKASYLNGTTCLLGVLAAAGLEPLLVRPRLRPLVWGALAAWATAAYFAYFVV